MEPYVSLCVYSDGGLFFFIRRGVSAGGLEKKRRPVKNDRAPGIRRFSRSDASERAFCDYLEISRRAIISSLCGGKRSAANGKFSKDLWIQNDAKRAIAER